MHYFGLKCSFEEVPVEKDQQNVYTDGEFRVMLPKGTGLRYMPKMTWIRVKTIYKIKLFLFYNIYVHLMLTFFLFRQTIQEIPGSTDFLWNSPKLVVPTSIINLTSLSTKNYLKKLFV
jgi:hypothetical protein